MLEMIERLLLEADLESQIPKVLYVCRAIYRGASGKFCDGGAGIFIIGRMIQPKCEMQEGARPPPPICAQGDIGTDYQLFFSRKGD